MFSYLADAVLVLHREHALELLGACDASRSARKARPIHNSKTASPNIIAPEAVGETMREDGEFYSTYGWHRRSTDVAIASIRRIIRDKRKLLAHVAEAVDLTRQRVQEVGGAIAGGGSNWSMMVCRSWRMRSSSRV